jgi:hypothetical protein
MNVTGEQIQPGTKIVHNGHDDMVLGSVERVVTNPQTGSLEEVHIRPGRADYLLRVPAELITVEKPDLIRIRADARLDEMEQLAIENGRTPPSGSNITEVGPTNNSPMPEEIVGNTPGMPSNYDGPATG